MIDLNLNCHKKRRVCFKNEEYDESEKKKPAQVDNVIL